MSKSMPEEARQPGTRGNSRRKRLAEKKPQRQAMLEPRPRQVEPTVKGLPVPAYATGATFLSPRMKARMAELGLHAADMAGIAGSGAGGRVTIEDLEKFSRLSSATASRPASPMRVAVADAMRRSATRPLATVVLARLLGCNALRIAKRAGRTKAGPALVLPCGLWRLRFQRTARPPGRLDRRSDHSSALHRHRICGGG